ncbi:MULTISPECIES: MarR family winged helix-turn-helix transcriptional regulator [Arthrobacter]|uniref:MarR family transcriptional regulator n=1 Tax=Arthrobacter caoxuetaonis TaxID=2886935 RepID=A0A9X1MAP0_9MICC|nr:MULTISPECIES: MarR family transcriptional regulator [Arthrobacter]MCC3281265.1 MarR family transcriptional regulator [Arthrobacter caoxuetaonis]MCC3296484.1 MarR family transcriptional regulator [Arthrobacter caoxuetaonis]MCC9192560.1 MarR family transcriptional regulator [Arthrobacter sp. zg-Y916]USQ56682.1 MarR family transcriptional regulator [Arthrobacter caoxuetaonis]
MNEETALDRLAEDFIEALREAVFLVRHMDTEFGITANQLGTLRMVSGDGMRVSDIARNLGIKVPSATEQIIRLEHAGLVRRSPDPLDSRGVRVTLTPDGSRKLAVETEQRNSLLAGMLAQLTDADREKLHDAMPVIAKVTHMGYSAMA